MVTKTFTSNEVLNALWRAAREKWRTTRRDFSRLPKTPPPKDQSRIWGIFADFLYDIGHSQNEFDSIQTVVFEHDGQTWQVEYEIGPTGYHELVNERDRPRTFIGTLVKPVQRVVTEWVPVKDASELTPTKSPQLAELEARIKAVLPERSPEEITLMAGVLDEAVQAFMGAFQAASTALRGVGNA